MRFVKWYHLDRQIIFVLWPMQLQKLTFVLFHHKFAFFVFYFLFEFIFQLGKWSSFLIQKTKFAILNFIETFCASVHIRIVDSADKMFLFIHSRNNLVVKQTIKFLQFNNFGFFHKWNYYWKAVDWFCKSGWLTFLDTFC